MRDKVYSIDEMTDATNAIFDDNDFCVEINRKVSLDFYVLSENEVKNMVNKNSL